MAFDVDFYINTDDPATLNKTPTKQFTTPMSPIGEVNELSPYFEVQYSSNYDSINYAYISEFGRWYFVSKSLLPNNMYGLSLTVDVLKSNETEIGNLTAVITRTGGITKPTYSQDPLLPIEPSRKLLKTFNFSSSPHGIKSGNNTYTTGVHLVIHTI